MTFASLGEDAQMVIAILEFSFGEKTDDWTATSVYFTPQTIQPIVHTSMQ